MAFFFGKGILKVLKRFFIGFIRLLTTFYVDLIIFFVERFFGRKNRFFLRNYVKKKTSS